MSPTTSNVWSPHLGAVSLTFDDGDCTQLTKALPLLERYHLRGTFFVSPKALIAPADIAAWQKAAAEGHEIGNHSWSHTGSANFDGSGGLEDWTLDQIEQDILRAQRMLTTLFPHQRAWTYAYPCYQTDVGRGASRQTYVPLVARHFLAGRALGEGHFGNHPRGVDLAKVWGIPAEHKTGHEMIGIVEEQAAGANKWVVLVFHTIEGYRLSAAGEDLEMLVAHLARRRDCILTEPFGAVAARIADAQARP